MEEKMTVKIIGMIIALMVTGAGIYYLKKEGKDDVESREIYFVITAVGALVAVLCIMFLIV